MGAPSFTIRAMFRLRHCRRCVLSSAWSGHGSWGGIVVLVVAFSWTTSFAFDREMVEVRVPALMKQFRVPGVSIAVVEEERIAWAGAWGVKRQGLEHENRIDDLTLFEAASMSKPLFAYAVLKLVEQGQLALDRRLTDYLDEPYLEDHPDHKLITARMVLNHSSGFPNWRKGGATGGGPLPVKFRPGSEFGYSGEGFLYLQRVVEHLTGEPMAEFMKRALMEPVGMRSSSYVFDEQRISRYAGGHDRDGKFKTGRKFYRRGNAAFTLYTTPSEYARFLIEVMSGDRSSPHSLSKQSVQGMLAPEIQATSGPEHQWRSLGWVVQQTDGGKRVSHSGSNGSGFRCHSRFYPDRGDGIVIMTNSSSGDRLWKKLIDEIDESTVVPVSGTAGGALVEDPIVFPKQAWRAAPEEFLQRRWNLKKLAELKERWAKVEEAGLSSGLLVIDSGYVAFEGGVTDQAIPCHSVRKSFLNALYGILERKGKLKLDATLGELGMTDGGQLSADESEATLLQVLQSRSGVYLPAEYETEKMKQRRPARHSHEPGSFYYYNNWDFNVAGAIYSLLDARGIGKAFQEDIANPLGMQDFDHTSDVILHHDSPQQSEYPAYPFLMSARDRARFGLLFLNRGSWAHDQVIVTEKWVATSALPHSSHESDGYHETKRPGGSKALGPGKGYGLLWWSSPTGWLYGQELGTVPAPPISARGYFGQVIAVVPSQQVVVVLVNDKRVNGQKATPGDVRNELFELIFAAKR